MLSTLRSSLLKKQRLSFLPGLMLKRNHGHDKHKNIVLDYWRERIGNREIVGYGFNGQPCYHDRPDFPFPAIRFGEPTAEIVALRQKEKGDWRLLTIEEKKRLYRYSFCQTFAEFLKIGTIWMSVLGWVLIACSAAMWLYIFDRLFVFGELPDSFTASSQLEQLARQLDLHVNEITGMSSDYDYEKKVWKRQPWSFTRPNPFEDNKCYSYEDEKEE